MASEELTPIQEFYKDATVFITGGTGFMGKILVEKLLRSCPEVRKIILLVRQKKGQNAHDRLASVFNDVIFDKIDEKSRLKVFVVDGDCSKPDLSLSETDRQSLEQEVNIVFHAAATVRFNEELGLAVAINVLGTKAMIDLAKDMQHLKAFVHVSTAYSNCHLNEIKETFYPTHIVAEDIINIVTSLDTPCLEHLSPYLLRNVPNSYVYTKSVAEDYVRANSKGLPLAVFRPSIIISTKAEPIPGWIDNVYGPTGVVVGGMTGMLRTIFCDPDAVADMVPMDMAVNALITTATTIKSGNNNNDQEEEPKIYNFVSSPDKPIKWNTFFKYCEKNLVPSMHAGWYPQLSMHKNRLIYKLDMIIRQLFPALLIDILARLTFRKTSVLSMMTKIDNFVEILSFFATRQWTFHNNNTVAMWESLDPKDKQLFPFNFKDHDWDSYYKGYMAGARRYLLKEEEKTIKAAKVKYTRQYWLNAVVQGIMGLGVFSLLFNFVALPLLQLCLKYFTT